jgi:drug/metabolite transporter (DMT)-like permease
MPEEKSSLARGGEPAGTSPIVRGATYALLAAFCFGITTPIVAQAGVGLGPFSTAALLYIGAAISALVLRLVSRSGAPLARAHFIRLGWIALFGAGIAPALLAWGLQRTGAATGSLLLNLEAVFTVVFARALYREPIGARVGVALLLMAIGGVVLVFDAASFSGFGFMGTAAVVGATAAWAFDNTLSRALAEQDPLTIVLGKGLLGASMTCALALIRGEPMPGLASVGILLLCGATGYGVSLRLYLLAQRQMGAARTGSIFAIAPFIGAGLSWVWNLELPSLWMAVSGALFGLGVYLHVTERHGHVHHHPAEEHTHAHRHDDGHHHHVHEPPFTGEHTHVHTHEAIDHEHEHAPDLHHDHRHP